MDNEGDGDNTPEDELNKSVGGSSGNASDQLDSSTETETFHKRMRTVSPRGSQMNFMTAASPPKYVNFDHLMKAANDVSNMSLAHQIAVDPNFQLSPVQPEENSISKQVTDVMHRAFWDALTQKLSEDPPDYSHALVLLAEIKENLLSLLLPQHQKLRDVILEVLDVDLIKQKVENDAFDLKYYADFLISIMAKLCAPVRDEKIASLNTLSDIVPLYREIFAILDLMKMDMANFTIQQIRPYLQQQSVEYERKKFQDFLKVQKEENIDGLELTRDWLTRASDRLQSKVTAELPLTPLNILNEAYMEIFTWNPARIIPETLVIDEGRYSELKVKVDKVILVSSIMLVTYNTVGEAISGITSLKEKLKHDIEVILDGVSSSEIASRIPNVVEQTCVDVNTCLKEHGHTELTDDKILLLRGQITGVTNPDNAVYKLIRNRVLDFIQQSIRSNHRSPIKIPPALSTFEGELSQVCGQSMRLVSYNRSVFGIWYSDIISGLLKREQELSDSATGTTSQ